MGAPLRTPVVQPLLKMDAVFGPQSAENAVGKAVEDRLCAGVQQGHRAPAWGAREAARVARGCGHGGSPTVKGHERAEPRYQYANDFSESAKAHTPLMTMLVCIQGVVWQYRLPRLCTIGSHPVAGLDGMASSNRQPASNGSAPQKRMKTFLGASVRSGAF